MSATKLKQKASAEFIASKTHTVIVLFVLGILAAGAVIRALRGSHDLVGPSGRLPLYAWILFVQLLLFWLVRVGIRRSGYSIRALVDQSSWTTVRWAGYVGIAVAAGILWMIFGAALGVWLKPKPDELRAVLQFLPHGRFEKLCWVAFSVGTNFCEEVLYRGYLLRQFRALTNSPAIALLLQAVVFAMGHVSLGMALMASVSLLALWLGALALWQKSLVPGMIMHIGISLFGGLLSPV